MPAPQGRAVRCLLLRIIGGWSQWRSGEVLMGVLKNAHNAPHRDLARQHLPHKWPLTGHSRLCCFTLIVYPLHSDPREAKLAERGEGERKKNKSLLLLCYWSQARPELERGGSFELHTSFHCNWYLGILFTTSVWSYLNPLEGKRKL